MADRLTVSGSPVITEDEQSGDVTAHVDDLEDASDGGAWETLKLAGYSEGDFYPIKTYSTRTLEFLSTTSSTYETAYKVNEFLIDASDLPGDMAYCVDYRFRSNGDEVFARLYNDTDGEVVAGSEGSDTSGTWTNITVGPNSYTPPTSDDLVTIEAQFKNSDGTTEVDLSIAQATIGVFL